MKRLIFMRHGYLEDKYKDYSKLSFNEFEELLLKKVSPEIDREKTKNCLCKKALLHDFNFILCSTEKRGIETAKIIKEITGISFEISNLLDEVNFSKGVINNEDIKDFNILRKRILTQLYYSKYSEGFEEVKKRFLELLDYTKSLNYDFILCITHGWFMRLIYLYSQKNNLEQISLKDLLDAKITNFLDSIEINILTR